MAAESSGADLGTETGKFIDFVPGLQQQVEIQTLFLYSSLLLHSIHCLGLQLSQGRGNFPEGVDTREGVAVDDILAVVAAAAVVVENVVASVGVVG